MMLIHFLKLSSPRFADVHTQRFLQNSNFIPTRNKGILAVESYSLQSKNVLMCHSYVAKLASIHVHDNYLLARYEKLWLPNSL